MFPDKHGKISFFSHLFLYAHNFTIGSHWAILQFLRQLIKNENQSSTLGTGVVGCNNEILITWKI